MLLFKEVRENKLVKEQRVDSLTWLYIGGDLDVGAPTDHAVPHVKQSNS
jgi:hypothetical protein